MKAQKLKQAAHVHVFSKWGERDELSIKKSQKTEGGKRKGPGQG